MTVCFDVINFIGNGYYIPKAGDQGLNVAIGLQTSKNQRGGARETSARYATAWLDHGVNQANMNYEYTIFVNKPLSTIQVSTFDREYTQEDLAS